MDNGESLILQMVTERRRELFGRRRTKFATRKRQNKWQEIHLALVDNGYISPLKQWNCTRSVWYRMVSAAKASLRKYTAGLQDSLHDQDKKVLDLLGIPIVGPIDNIPEQENQVVVEESRTMIEHLELLEGDEEDEEEEEPTDLSQISDMELKKALLRQELKINDYRLLKLKFYFLKSGNRQLYEHFLKQIET